MLVADTPQYSLRLECRLPDSSRPIVVELPFALRSGLTVADLEAEPGPPTRSTFLGFELFKSGKAAKPVKGKGKDVAAGRNSLSLVRTASSSASSTVYSGLSVEL